MVKIEPATLADILLAIELCPVEVSGYAQAKKIGGDFLIFGEPDIAPQTCSLGGTEFDLEAHGLWEREMMLAKRGPEINLYRLWWHSHVGADAVFSATDKEMIASWEGTPAEWWLSFVGNKWGEFSLRLDIYRPRRETTAKLAIDTTEKIDKEGFRSLMLSRRERVERLISDRVKIKNDDTAPFDRILRGVFGG